VLFSCSNEISIVRRGKKGQRRGKLTVFVSIATSSRFCTHTHTYEIVANAALTSIFLLISTKEIGFPLHLLQKKESTHTHTESQKKSKEKGKSQLKADKKWLCVAAVPKTKA